MSHRRLVNLLGGSLLCLGLGSCVLHGAVDDWAPMPAFTIGGTVVGVTGPIALQNSNGTNLIVAEDGSFTFGTPMVSSALYNVTVAVAPNSQACNVTNGSGTVAGADISNVKVICTPITYMLGSR